mmetsp:Transcript_23368/g.34641  ORF Transcript_23368/g.34641 Transcript_23368/m.34641 type:complete len:90 (-) Transcript_23368:436-705(-)
MYKAPVVTIRLRVDKQLRMKRAEEASSSSSSREAALTPRTPAMNCLRINPPSCLFGESPLLQPSRVSVSSEEEKDQQQPIGRRHHQSFS